MSEQHLASCGHPANVDGECDCSSWPERAPVDLVAELEQAEARRAADLAERRASNIAGLRQLANWLEDHPGVEMPYTMGGAVFAELTEVRAMMAAAPGGWDKKDSGDYWAYDRKFAGHVTFTAYVSREQLCQKVKIGTKTVAAEPEHEVDIYRWECAPVDELDAT